MGQTKPAAGLKSLNRAADTLSTLLAQEVKELNERQKDLLRQLEQSLGGKEYEGRKTFADKIKEIFNN